MTFDLDLEGWPWPFTTQNVQLHEIHIHDKYQVAIFNIAKVMANVKVFGRPDDADGGPAGYDNTSGFLGKQPS